MRILCYCPYVGWGIHALWEGTWLLAMALDGAEVTYVLCDGALPACDFDTPQSPHAREKCEDCRAAQASFVDKLTFPRRWLGDFLDDRDKHRIAAWSAALEPAAMAMATYDGRPVSRWIRTTLHRTHRTNVIDLADRRMAHAFRDHLAASALAWTGLSRAFDAIRPDLLVTVNGHRSSTRVALELARSRGVRALCHERGQRRESFSVFENDHCMAPDVYRQLWDRWGGVPLTEDEIGRSSAFIADRMRGVNLNWRAYSSPPAGVAKLHRQLGLDPGRPIWSLFTSTSDELVGLEGFDDTVASQQYWLLSALQFAGTHPEIQLVVRAHPNSAAIRQDAEFIDHVSTTAPANCRVVPPTVDISSYDLAAASTVGLAFNSTLAIEMAANGICVLFSGDGRYRDLPFLRTANSLKLFQEHCGAALSIPILHRRHEIGRLAHRFVYAWIFRWLFHFPLVEMGAVHEGRARYADLQDLARGRDPSLDRLRDIVFRGDPVIPRPSAAELRRSDEDERRFFGLNSPLQYTAS
ncbi:MAG: hypothetical protein HYR63_24560 [Proteobacteria bacterium]|nr:hypothetical protein [Pseudomonadota bacterium]